MRNERMRAFRVAYDGAPYYGFQRQPDVETVSGALLDALAALDVIEDGDENSDIPPGYAAAGRTDAGVSAVAQTVGFEAPEWLTPTAFNSELPESIRVWAHAACPADFHPTHDAVEREYTYHLHAASLDESQVRAALDTLSGHHDFRNLTPDETGTVRTLSTSLSVEGSYFVIQLTAGGFARQLVRRLITLVTAVGAGERSVESIETLLTAETVSGPEGVGPASPIPLVLTGVAYPDLTFEVDLDAATAARQLFEQQRIERETAARVSGRIVAGMAADDLEE